MWAGLLVLALAAEQPMRLLDDVRWLELPAGRFRMGDETGWDRRPVHEVTFRQTVRIAATPVTNRQFEAWQPTHAAQRGRDRTPYGDDDPVVFVTWAEATDFCRWLAEQTGRPLRLPTEAEWEYAARTLGERLEQAELIETWCRDWYGPYGPEPVVEPVGAGAGPLRVTRGGPLAVGEPAARLSNVPEDRNRVLGLRLVEGPVPAGATSPPASPPRWATAVDQAPATWASPAPTEPYFGEPLEYVHIPPDADGPLFATHNHDPGLAWCPNGDLLAIWYSCRTEAGRELTVAASRLRRGAAAWDEADLFWDVAGRNDHAPALWQDGRGRLYHVNGLGVEGGWRELALLLRTSDDNGVTWSSPRLINPAHGLGNQPIGSLFEGADGTIYLPCDATWAGAGGSVLHRSRDGGRTWFEPSAGRPAPKFEAGLTGDWIAGIHTGCDEWAPGQLVAVGRGDAIDQRLARSVSRDGGLTWTYAATPFPPLGGGQRPVLRKLREGPLLLCSFTPGSTFTDAAGRERRGSGLFAALSDDGGVTWPTVKLLTDGVTRELRGGAWTKTFTLTAEQAEPKGYLTACQTPDGVIHLLSSGVHYRFNLAWLRQPAGG